MYKWVKFNSTLITLIVAVLLAYVLNAVISGVKIYNMAVFDQSYLKMLMGRIFLSSHKLLNHCCHINLCCLCHLSAALSFI